MRKILISNILSLFGQVSTTVSPDQNYLTRLANSVKLLCNGEQGFKQSMKGLNGYISSSHLSILSSLNIVNEKELCELCFRIADVKEIDEFVIECLKATNDIFIFKKTSMAMLSVFSMIKTQSDYDSFVQGVLKHNDQSMKEKLFVKTKSWGGTRWNLLVDGICNGINWLAMLNDDIEYTVACITFNRCDNNTIEVVVTGRILPIARVVMDYYVEQSGIKFSAIKTVIFKSVIFFEGCNFFDFIDNKRLPDGCAVKFQNCKFADGIFEISNADVNSMEGIEAIEIAFCALFGIGKNISRLQKLRDVILHDNQLRKIPDVLFDLTQLKVFSMANEKLTKIPNKIRKFTKLEKLHLYGNLLTEISSDLTCMTTLKELLLYKNRISEIPDTLTNLKNLEVLDISKNDISEIKVDFTRFPLALLNIARNPLKAIPDSIYRLQTLVHLNIGDLGIKRLPRRLDLPMLTTLILSNNKLESL